MFSFLLPREDDFFQYFDAHAQLIVDAAQLFKKSVSIDIFESSNAIKEIEHKADQITHICLESLHKTFITPIDREDIYRLIQQMDDIIDCIDEAYDRLMIYKLQTMNTDVRNLANVIVLASLEVQKAVTGLKDLTNSEDISKICIRIGEYENQADDILRAAISRLFEEESDIRLVIKWKEIYENLEKATDVCDHVGELIQGIILEHG